MSDGPFVLGTLGFLIGALACFWLWKESLTATNRKAYVSGLIGTVMIFIAIIWQMSLAQNKDQPFGPGSDPATWPDHGTEDSR